MSTGKWLGISPREAWLELEYARLKGEVEYLRAMHEPQGISYSMGYEPQMLSMNHTSDTLRLAAQAGADVDRAANLHVYVKETIPGGVGLKYFVSILNHRTERDRAAVLEEMHKRLVFDLAHQLWSGK